ncbi:lipoate-protein ligase [Hathewaya proteolytica DSM 3090]|uniref:lipoate--protein ligase n=1 Tax=Hathewaya proteolytica DSM 3090 TaxID=1121331 RepID=A0A1M6J950_9CLOT|nr:lipoate--protein ligase [Hathewaya proteolytica]SHJ43213.1 lipoate-protein ligase [Hathewaya proteolytica DSM 3090]
MIFVKNENTNPYLNHAVEEYIMNKFQDDCFMLWRNESCILIGKNQDIMSEINTEYIKEHNITVVRRMSGGGAVFNDLGNLNFTFISKKAPKQGVEFSTFTAPIIEALSKLGVKAELSGRNDITIDNKKISGNAQFHSRDKVIHHGTLLFSSCISDLVAALKVKEIKFSDKTVKSVASRVSNLSEYLNEPMSVIEFKEFLFDYVFSTKNNGVIYELNEEDWGAIKIIAENKYCTRLWNYGSSPKFNFHGEKKFPGGIVQANMFIENDIIQDININGDFFSEKDVSELENLIRYNKYQCNYVREALREINVSEYMSNISFDDLINVMF